MDSMTIISKVVSIITAGLTIAIGSIGPALVKDAERRWCKLRCWRNNPMPPRRPLPKCRLFCLAMVESVAIYCSRSMSSVRQSVLDKRHRPGRLEKGRITLIDWFTVGVSVNFLLILTRSL
ncbi:hypothetical protein ACVBEG_27620 [Pseudomonas sp. GG8]